MPHLRYEQVTVTLSTLGAGSGYSTSIFNGFVQQVHLQISKAIGASGQVQVTAETTTRTLLNIKDPSTLLTWYYPRGRAQTSTGATMPSSSPVFLPIINQRARVAVATSSGLSGQTVTVGLTVGGY